MSIRRDIENLKDELEYEKIMAGELPSHTVNFTATASANKEEIKMRHNNDFTNPGMGVK